MLFCVSKTVSLWGSAICPQCFDHYEHIRSSQRDKYSFSHSHTQNMRFCWSSFANENCVSCKVKVTERPATAEPVLHQSGQEVWFILMCSDWMGLGLTAEVYPLCRSHVMCHVLLGIRIGGKSNLKINPRTALCSVSSEKSCSHFWPQVCSTENVSKV